MHMKIRMNETPNQCSVLLVTLLTATIIGICLASYLTANGWTVGSDGRYHKTRSIGDDGTYYQVAIEPVNPPVIISEGFVPAPFSASSQLGMIQSPSQIAANYVSRRVQ